MEKNNLGITTIKVLEKSLIETYGKAVHTQNYLLIPELDLEMIIFRFFENYETPKNIFGNVLLVEKKGGIYKIYSSRDPLIVSINTTLSIGLYKIIIWLSGRKISTEDLIWNLISDTNEAE